MTNTTATSTALPVAKFENVTVSFASLNKADKFKKYGLTIEFADLTPEQQEQFESIAYTNKDGVKMLTVSSFKKLPKGNIILPEGERFINKGDKVTIIAVLNKASNGKHYPEQALIKLVEKAEEVIEEKDNQYAEFVSDIETLKALL